MANDNAYMNEYMKRRYHRRMAEAREKLGNRCANCGESENLEFDHIDPSTKSFTLGKKAASVSEEKFQNELAKCQLLCKPCHEEKTLKDNQQVSAKKTHGTLSSYRYCKCDLCVAAMRDYNKEYNLRKRENKLP